MTIDGRCVFCGGDDMWVLCDDITHSSHLVKTFSGDPPEQVLRWYTFCKWCESCGPTGSTKEEAIEFWRSRKGIEVFTHDIPL